MATDDRRGVWIPEELWEATRAAARDLSVRHGRDVSASAIVRDGLRVMLNRFEREEYALEVPGAETGPEIEEETDGSQ